MATAPHVLGSYVTSEITQAGRFALPADVELGSYVTSEITQAP